MGRACQPSWYGAHAGGKATGYGTETQADFADFCERAETRALGRALAVLGFGTQFVGQDLTEGEHVADAPVARPVAPSAAMPVNGDGEASHGDTSLSGHDVPPLPSRVAPACGDLGCGLQ
jgi:hypothetical protein